MSAAQQKKRDGWNASLKQAVGRKKLGLIHADPPWAFATRGNGDQVPARGEQPYKTMKLEDLKSLDMDAITKPDCVLVMWTTSANLQQSIELAAAWGFKFKSLGLVWEKTCKGDPEKLKMGMGFWFRQECEVSLLFTKGSPKRLSAGVRQVIREPAREHSRKPDEALLRCEALADGPYLDLFGRCTRKGWVIWGKQSKKFDRQADDLT